MAANVYLRSFELDGPAWVRLADQSTVLNATLIASILNAQPLNVRWNGGTPAAWPPGAAALFESVDLAEFEVQGTGGLALLVVAYSR